MVKEIDIKGQYKVKIEGRYFTLSGSEVKSLIIRRKITNLAIVCKVN